MGQLINGFLKYRDDKKRLPKCENCDRNYGGFCQMPVPKDEFSPAHKWLEDATVIVMADQLDWKPERFEEYIRVNTKSMVDVVRQSTDLNGNISMRCHETINKNTDCPSYTLNRHLESNIIEDVVSYAKTLKFSFK